jgi:hypothetical protein
MPTNQPLNNNITTLSPGGLGYPPGQVYVVAGGVGGSNGSLTTNIAAGATWSTANTLNVPVSGRMELRGNQADIVINDVSLNDTLRSIQDRLNMLRPNPELEQEWDQLRDLGEQYRDLEKQLMEKQRAWDLLRKKEG